MPAQSESALCERKKAKRAYQYSWVKRQAGADFKGLCAKTTGLCQKSVQDIKASELEVLYFMAIGVVKYPTE